MSDIQVTVNGKTSALLTKLMNGGKGMTDLERNEALTRKIEKLKDKLEVDFIKDTEKLSNEELERKVLAYAEELERNEDERANHKELQAAKEAKSTLEKGFNGVKKHATLRMQFVLATLKSRGA